MWLNQCQCYSFSYKKMFFQIFFSIKYWLNKFFRNLNKVKAIKWIEGAVKWSKFQLFARACVKCCHEKWHSDDYNDSILFNEIVCPFYDKRLCIRYIHVEAFYTILNLRKGAVIKGNQTIFPKCFIAMLCCLNTISIAVFHMFHIVIFSL